MQFVVVHRCGLELADQCPAPLGLGQGRFRRADEALKAAERWGGGRGDGELQDNAALKR